MGQDQTETPYGEIFSDLVSSIMRAQAEVLAARQRTAKGHGAPDALINRHFAWLCLSYRPGLNRHLYDGTAGNAPLRTRALRAPSRIPLDLRALLDRREPVPTAEGLSELRLVQTSPTRISRLVQESFAEGRELSDAIKQQPDGVPAGVLIKSPLAIAFDYLTVPEMPSSRAYVLVTLRTFLFRLFDRVPRGTSTAPESATFSVGDIEEALSHIWTSLRPRFLSAGEDKLPAEGRSPAGALLRQYLAARGMLWLRFANEESCISFLKNGTIRPSQADFEFAKSTYLDRLPDLGELINELWGIPIPIRGADTLFRGGLRLANRGGLVVAVHGGPGVGKTSLALAMAAVLAPFGINSLFLTAEEEPEDLLGKMDALLSDDLRRRLSFFPQAVTSWLHFQRFALEGENVASDLAGALERLATRLNSEGNASLNVGLVPSCRAMVVLDGLHDLLMSFTGANLDQQSSNALLKQLREFITTCRKLRAIVILTTGDEWAGNRALDYLVDVAIRLSHHGVSEYGKKPDRRVVIAKARNQLCSIGTHGFQIAGTKGVRFSPQINYQLDRRAVWKTRLPEASIAKTVLKNVLSQPEYARLAYLEGQGHWPDKLGFHLSDAMVTLPRGSNIFLNGAGAGGKAALALKIAIAPLFDVSGKSAAASAPLDAREKVLVVSFLYPFEYYDHIFQRLTRLRRLEYPSVARDARPDLSVIHLYPGFYQPDHLFNRIEWELDAAELQGRPYTAVIVDGIHNVFLQFPEIANYSIFWPQLYASLRTRAVTIISTHTTFVLQGHEFPDDYRLDDRQSEPLRHALVQKVDFRFEIDPVAIDDSNVPVSSEAANIFVVRTISAIGQPIPNRDIYWSRESLVLFDPAQARLPFPKRRPRLG